MKHFIATPSHLCNRRASLKAGAGALVAARIQTDMVNRHRPA